MIKVPDWVRERGTDLLMGRQALLIKQMQHTPLDRFPTSVSSLQLLIHVRYELASRADDADSMAACEIVQRLLDNEEWLKLAGFFR